MWGFATPWIVRTFVRTWHSDTRRYSGYNLP